MHYGSLIKPNLLSLCNDFPINIKWQRNFSFFFFLPQRFEISQNLYRNFWLNSFGPLKFLFFALVFFNVFFFLFIIIIIN